MRLPTSQYRGVVGQSSGKWGAQIYKNNERIWLGTFWTEVEAAQTYDLAARHLHETTAVTNFNSQSKSDKFTEAELCFLKSHTVDDMLSMLRRKTYHEELKRSQYMHQIQHLSCNDAGTMMPSNGKTCETLFFKVVSPGDVGPRNRLLIPRYHAQKHFQLFRNSSRSSTSNSTCGKGVMINVGDEKGKVWRFRYAYWGSNRNHVLNGEWALFAKEKGLKPGHVIRFLKGTEPGDERLFIECDTHKTEKIALPECELPTPQPDMVIRLFGADISVPHNN